MERLSEADSVLTLCMWDSEMVLSHAPLSAIFEDYLLCMKDNFKILRLAPKTLCRIAVNHLSTFSSLP